MTTGARKATGVFRDCTFRNNTASVGGALQVVQGTLSVADSRFEQNAAASGAALHVDTRVGDQVQLHVTNSTFHRNTAFEPRLTLTARGGAVYVGVANTTWSAVSFTNNTAQGKLESSGGGIAFHAASTNMLTSCVFSGNTAFKGGAVALTSPAVRVWMKSTQVRSNTATDTKMTDALSSYGGGLWAASGAQAWLSTMVFEGNRAKYGAGLAVAGPSQLELHQSQVDANLATAGGAGLDVDTGGNVTISHCSMSKNRAHFGGALNVKGASLRASQTSFARNQGAESGGVLYVRSTPNVSFDACHFTANEAHSVVGGGVMYSDSPSITSFVKSTFTANQATHGEGGVLLLNMKAVARFQACEFTHNSAYMAGGALSTHASFMAVSDSRFSHNRVTYAAGGGGAVSIADGSQPQFTNTSFENHAGDWGSVMRIAASQPVLTSCAIRNNTALRGCLYIGQQSLLTVTNSSFENNQALVTPPARESNGAAMQINDGVVMLLGSRFSGNQALRGAGGSVWVGVSGVLNGSGCVFAGNSATSGGAVAVTGKSTSTITGAMFSNNIASTGGALQVGAKASLSLSSSILDSNQATIDQGGALVAERSSFIVLRGVSFLKNTAATFGGGAWFSTGCRVNIWGDMSFRENTAGDAGGGMFFTSRRGPTKSSRWTFEANRAGTYGHDLATDVNRAVWSSTQEDFRDGAISEQPLRVTLVDGYESPVTSTKLGNGIECRLSSTAEIIAGARIEFSSLGVAVWDTAKLQGTAGTWYDTSFRCQWQRCVDGVVTVSNSTVVKKVQNTACRRGEFTEHFKKTRWCRVCPTGQYAVSVVNKCSRCPREALCEGGDHMRPKLGAWEAAPNRSKVYRCPFPAKCLGGEDSACGPGHTGRVCGECLPGYTRTEGGCVACDRNEGVTLAMPGLAMLLLAVVGWFGYRYIYPDPPAEDETDSLPPGFFGVGIQMQQASDGAMKTDESKATLAQQDTESLNRDLGGTIRILVGHLQILSLFYGSMPHVTWPPLFGYLSKVAVVLNLNLINLVPVGCFIPGMDSFYCTFSLTMAVPIVLWLVLWLKSQIEHRAKSKLTTDRQVKTFVWLIYLMYPFLCSTVLQFFKCRQIEDTWVIAADVSLVCYDDKYYTYMYVGAAAFVLYVVGIPLVLYIVLKRNEDKLWTDAHMLERYGVLYMPYKEDRWSSELVEMVRKLMLVGPVIFFMPGSAIQIGLPTMISFGFLILHQEKQPFQSPSVNKAYRASIMAIVLTLSAAMVLIGLGCGASEDPGSFMPMQWGLYLTMMLFNVYAVGTQLYTVYVQMTSLQEASVKASSLEL